MNYNDFSIEEQHHINGVIAKYMDTYIRVKLVWTPEQMYCDLLEQLKAEHATGWYAYKSKVDGEWVFPMKQAQLWMVSDDGRDFIISRFTAKYERNKKLARKKAPICEIVRFGLRWEEMKNFDIGYGLKENGTNGYSNEKTEIVENTELIPWSVTHVENELREKHGTCLKDCLISLSTSPIEKMFYEYWLEHFYHPDNPAIIPEIYGERHHYSCYKLDDNYSLRFSLNSKTVNVRFDFAIVNFHKQTKLLIELDGHDYHKTFEQRNNDAIKRTIATNNGWQLNVITGTQINRDIEGCFDAIKNFLLPK
ncbi:hypothetical protein C2W64_01361 [Brevibacillus laterosporus]|nr:hypothetical protein [Brevibacillus laterosporus]RAP26645.1 hypothetical protein C2W64_01361 [Brevibacillus laterosporus]